MTRDEIQERLAEIEEERQELGIELNRIPVACKCDIDDWRDGKVKGICFDFEESENGLCKRCEHEEECH